MTKKYLDKQLFEKFSIDYGDIIWNDYEMCFQYGFAHLPSFAEASAGEAHLHICKSI
jgi:hypothetical protein